MQKWSAKQALKFVSNLCLADSSGYYCHPQNTAVAISTIFLCVLEKYMLQIMRFEECTEVIRPGQRDVKCFQLPLASGISELSALQPQAFRKDLFFLSLCSQRSGGLCFFPPTPFLPKVLWRNTFDFLGHKNSSLILCPVVKCSFICWTADSKDFLHKRCVSKHRMSCSILQCGRCVNDNSEMCS